MVAGLLMSDGNTNYTRFVARFIEVLSAADLIRMPLETIAAMELGKGSAVSLVQNSAEFSFMLPKSSTASSRTTAF